MIIADRACLLLSPSLAQQVIHVRVKPAWNLTAVVGALLGYPVWLQSRELFLLIRVHASFNRVVELHLTIPGSVLV